MSHALRREYAYYSWQYNFPDEIEQALEDNYVECKFMYSENTLKGVAAMLLLHSVVSPQHVLDYVRAEYQSRKFSAASIERDSDVTSGK